MASRPSDEELVHTRFIGVPVLRFSPDQLVMRDLKVASIRSMPTSASSIALPARTPDQAVSLLDHYRKTSETGEFKTLELTYEIASGVTDEFARVTQAVHDDVRNLVADFRRNPDEAPMLLRLDTMRSDLVNHAKRMMLPVRWLHLDNASDEAIQAAVQARGNLRTALIAREAGLQHALERISAELRDGTAQWLRNGDDQLLMLKRFADRLEMLDRYIGVIPVGAAAGELLAAQNETEAREALHNLAKEIGKFGVDKALAAGAGLLIVAFVPTTFGFFATSAVGIAVGVGTWKAAEPIVKWLGFEDERPPRIELR